MNPLLIILVLLLAVVLWFLLSFLFYPLGKFVTRIFKDAVDEINRKDKNNDEKGEENNER